MVRGGHGPLQRPLVLEPRVGHTGVVAPGSARERRELVEDLARARVRKRLLPSHLLREPREDDGVGQRLARGRDELRQVREPPLRVGHHAVLLRPLRGGQQDVREARRVGRVIRVLDDDEVGLPQRLLDEIEVRHRRRGIRAHDPHGADVTARERLEHVECGETGRGRDASWRDAPVALDDGARGRIRDRAIARQQVRKTAGLAAPHGVRLSRQ